MAWKIGEHVESWGSQVMGVIVYEAGDYGIIADKISGGFVLACGCEAQFVFPAEADPVVQHLSQAFALMQREQEADAKLGISSHLEAW